MLYDGNARRQVAGVRPTRQCVLTWPIVRRLRDAPHIMAAQVTASRSHVRSRTTDIPVLQTLQLVSFLNRSLWRRNLVRTLKHSRTEVPSATFCADGMNQWIVNIRGIYLL